MAEKKTYQGYIPQGGTAAVKAPNQKKSKHSGTVNKGSDLRSGK